MSRKLNLAALEKKVDVASRQAMKKVKAGQEGDPFLCGRYCLPFNIIIGLETMMINIEEPVE
jgi:hypothetical protein